MEMELQSWAAIFLLSILSFFIFLKKKKKKKKKNSTKLPPGPWKLPIIGSVHHLTGDLPHRRLRDLSLKHGPLMHLQLGEISTVVVSSDDTAREVLKTHDLALANRPELLAARILTYGYTDILFSPYGDYWRQLRRICVLELLSARRVESFRRVRGEEVADMIRTIHEQSIPGDTQVDLTELFLSLTNNIISRAAFGEKCKHKDRLLVSLQEALELIVGFHYTDLFPSLEFTAKFTGYKRKLERLHRRIDGIFDEIIEERRKKRGDREGEEVEEENLLDVLLRLQEQGGDEFSLTTDNMKAVILDLFAGGTDTSANALEWAMSELMRNPRAMEKAQSEVRKICASKTKVDETSIAEMNYLKLVINENFRLHPPAALVSKESRESCVIGGYEIPTKTRVLVNVWAIGRDPKHWENPERFEPKRFHDGLLNYKGTSFEFLPFGGGRRVCPGMTFAVATVELALVELLRHFNWEMPNRVSPEELDMDESPGGATVGRKSHLCLVPALAKPQPS